jgi:hypothetical protein
LEFLVWSTPCIKISCWIDTATNNQSSIPNQLGRQYRSFDAIPHDQIPNSPQYLKLVIHISFITILLAHLRSSVPMRKGEWIERKGTTDFIIVSKQHCFLFSWLQFWITWTAFKKNKLILNKKNQFFLKNCLELQ